MTEPTDSGPRPSESAPSTPSTESGAVSPAREEREAQPGWLSFLTRGERVLAWMFPVVLLLSLVRVAVDEQFHVLYELGWVYSFTLAALGPSFLRARREALDGILARYAHDVAVFQEIHRGYCDRSEQGRQPVMVGFLAGTGFVLFRSLVSWDLIPYSHELSRLVLVLVGGIGFGLMARTLWLFLSFGYLITRMSQELEIRQETLFSWELLERAGKGYARTASGAALLSLGIFWMASAAQRTILGGGGTLVEQLLTILLFFFLALLLPLVYLVLPVWRLHRILVVRKNRVRDLFAGDLAAVEQQFLLNPSRELGKKYFEIRSLASEAERLPEWPFRAGMVAQMFTLIAIPALLFIGKEVLVDVLVELLKK